MSISTCSNRPVRGFRWLVNHQLLKRGSSNSKGSRPESTAVHLIPVGNAAAAQPKVDEIKRVLSKVPRTLVISRNPKADIGQDSSVKIRKNDGGVWMKETDCSGCMFARSIPQI